jgi:signal transduction histidine kinase
MDRTTEHTPDILIIDDNDVDREAIKRYISRSKRGTTFSFHEATTGAQGKEMMESRPYDCIFLDYRLPDTDGISLLRQFYNPRADLATSPVIMMTGQSNETAMIDALRLGAQDYILKENISPESITISMIKAREMFEAKRARRQAEEQLQHTLKMEAIGQLTSGIAHDFNNLLTVVSGNAHLLRRRLKAGTDKYSAEDIEAKVQAIESAAQRGAELVRRLMVFTRQSPLAQEAADISRCIAETAGLLKMTLGETIEVRTVTPEGAWPVFIDAAEFSNILINFAVNARDAMPDGGRLTFEVENVTLDDAYTLWNPEVTPGQYVMVAVSDTGSGMPPEIRRRVFEPFFTTKPAGKGTGLGMSMAWGFVRQCGGHIHLYSEEGRGTVFKIYLPRHNPGAIAVPVDPAAPLPGGSETILVAEDDEIVRLITAAMLETMGYRVVQAPTARAALAMLETEHSNVDLVFTDIVMPDGMSGIDLVAKMRTHYPHIKALYGSGYTSNAIPDYNLQPGEDLISKPYNRETLALKVREVLDGGRKEERHARKARAGH